MRVIDCCPPWLATELRKLIADRVMKGFATSHDEELRRVREAVDWLDRRVTTDTVTSSGTSRVSCDCGGAPQ